MSLCARPSWHDRILALAAWMLAATVPLVLLALGMELLRRGWSRLEWDALWTAPRDFGRSGGLAPVVVATLWTTALALVIAVPSAVAAAVALVDAERAGRRTARIASLLFDVVAAAPSIVLGLFGMLVFGEWLGLGYSVLTGALTLACMVLPVVVRLVADALRAVPEAQRRAARALGMSRWGRLRVVELPLAWPGVVAGTLLGMGRALSETAALLFTAGYALHMPTSPADGGRTLAVHIYDLAFNVPGGQASAAAAALLLLVVVAVIAIAVNLLARWWRHRQAWT